MFNFDWSDSLNEKSMAAPEWSGRIKFISLASVKYLIWNFHTLGTKSLHIEFYVLTIPQIFLKVNTYKFDGRGLLLIQKINVGFGG